MAELSKAIEDEIIKRILSLSADQMRVQIARVGPGLDALRALIDTPVCFIIEEESG